MKTTYDLGRYQFSLFTLMFVTFAAAVLARFLPAVIGDAVAIARLLME
jgi:hypothetical protein